MTLTFPRAYQKCPPCTPPSKEVLQLRLADLKSKTSKRIAISVKAQPADVLATTLDAAQDAEVYVNAYVFEDPEAALQYYTTRPHSQSSVDVVVISKETEDLRKRLGTGD